jgi:hypothetical protein
MAVFAPTPSAMVSDAASVKPRARMSRRSAYRTSKFIGLSERGSWRSVECVGPLRAWPVIQCQAISLS